MNYLPQSLFIHAAFAFIVLHLPAVNTSSGVNKIDIDFVAKDQKPLFPTTSAKSLKQGKHDTSKEKGPKKGVNTPAQEQKGEKVDLTDYANRLKIVVDPVWVRNIGPARPAFTVEVFINVDKAGNIGELRIIKSSGFVDVDRIAITTFREVGVLPIPPEILVKEGIIWAFSAQ